MPRCACSEPGKGGDAPQQGQLPTEEGRGREGARCAPVLDVDAVFSRYRQQRYPDLIFSDETSHLSDAE